MLTVSLEREGGEALVLVTETNKSQFLPSPIQASQLSQAFGCENLPNAAPHPLLAGAWVLAVSPEVSFPSCRGECVCGVWELSRSKMLSALSSEKQPLPRSLCTDTEMSGGSAYVKRRKRAASMRASDHSVGC